MFVVRRDEGEAGQSEAESREPAGRLQEMVDEMSEVEVGSADIGETDPTEIMDGPRAREAFEGGETDAHEDEATEVVSDGSAPAFLEERDDAAAKDDGTIEMRNPFLGAHDDEGPGAPPVEFEEEDDDETTKVDRDAFGEVFGEEFSEEPGAGEGDGAADRSSPDGGPALHSYQGQTRDTAAPSSTTEEDETTSEVHPDDVDVRVGDDASSPPSPPPPDAAGDGPSEQSLRRQGRDSGPVSETARPGRSRRDSGDVPPSSRSSQHVPAVENPPQSAQSSHDSGGGHEAAWTVKARHGLTYDFSDTDALRDWLAQRDRIDHLRISADGSNFFEPAAFPQLEGVGGRATAGQGGRPQGPSSTSPPPIPSESERPPSPGVPHDGGSRGETAGDGAAEASNAGRSDAADWSQALEATVPDTAASGRSIGVRALYPILFVLILVASGVFLDVSGMYPVGRMVPVVPSTFDNQATTSEPSETTAEAPSSDESSETSPSSAAEDSEPKDRVGRLLDSARSAIDRKQWQTAIETLKAAKLLAPKRADTYRLLAEVYEQLGNAQLAEKHRKKAEELAADSKGDPSRD